MGHGNEEICRIQGVKVKQSIHMADYQYQLYYRAWHDESVEHAEQMTEDASTMLAPLVADRKHGAVLDVGCGMGFALLGMRRLGFTNVFGLEVDQGQAESARKKGLIVDWVSNPLEFLEDTSSQYSIILLLDVLEHIPVTDQICFLRALFNRLEDGGRLIVQTPNANAVFAARWRYNDYTHTSSFTEHSLRFCLLNAGFSAISIVKNDRLYRPSLRLWQSRARASWACWILEKLWRMAFRYQFGSTEDISKVPFGLNILGYADKCLGKNV